MREYDIGMYGRGLLVYFLPNKRNLLLLRRSELFTRGIFGLLRAPVRRAGATVRARVGRFLFWCRRGRRGGRVGGETGGRGECYRTEARGFDFGGGDERKDMAVELFLAGLSYL